MAPFPPKIPHVSGYELLVVGVFDGLPGLYPYAFCNLRVVRIRPVGTRIGGSAEVIAAAPGIAEV